MPKSGVIAGVHVQAISAYAPHVNAAKLWFEYLYSDEGQTGWLISPFDYREWIDLPLFERQKQGTTGTLQTVEF